MKSRANGNWILKKARTNEAYLKPRCCPRKRTRKGKNRCKESKNKKKSCARGRKRQKRCSKAPKCSAKSRAKSNAKTKKKGPCVSRPRRLRPPKANGCDLPQPCCTSY